MGKTVLVIVESVVTNFSCSRRVTGADTGFMKGGGHYILNAAGGSA